jgi:hypothetical protein
MANKGTGPQQQCHLHAKQKGKHHLIFHQQLVLCTTFPFGLGARAPRGSKMAWATK